MSVKKTAEKAITTKTDVTTDSNPTTWKLCKMNLAIRHIEADLGGAAADTFFKDAHPAMKADYILANPPFNLSDWGAGKLAEDKRWKFGIPPAGNANFAWMQHMIFHMSAKGRIGMVLANGSLSLSSQSGGEGEIRKKIVEDDLVEGIIAMPPQLFYTTQIPVSLWFLNRAKKQRGKTLFIDARNMGTMVNRRLREMTDEDIAKVASSFEAFAKGELKGEAGFCAVASIEDIAKQDFIMTPSRFVGFSKQCDEGEPFNQKMARLTGELTELFEQGHLIELKIKERLGVFGYEV